jgi:hypothetical protein
MLAKGHGEIQTYARHQTKRDRMAEIERNNIRALLVYGDESEGGQDRPGRRGNDRARAKGGKTEHER